VPYSVAVVKRAVRWAAACATPDDARQAQPQPARSPPADLGGEAGASACTLCYDVKYRRRDYSCSMTLALSER
jgi:hypothetical protein